VQWLINEFKQLKVDVAKKVEDAIAEHVQKQIEAAERITKLEGEIKAMKARMGRKQD
jgi:hypothetical protein